MKKIENIIDNCKGCKFCQRFNPHKRGFGSAFVCEKNKQLLALGKSVESIAIPDWCPLETYKEAEQPEAQLAPVVSAPSTIILPGMPHLEWMTENLSGFGGTEVEGRTYYTYDEAVEAVEQLGDGWRLPTRGEMVDLDDLGSVWQEDGPQGLPGRLFGGGLFLPAAGYRDRASGGLTNVGTGGYYWSSSSFAAGNVVAGYFSFDSGSVGPLSLYGGRAYGFSVRCVRNVK